MANESKKAFDGLLETYVSLGESAGPIVRQLKKTANADTRRKLVQELRNLDKKRLELLDQMDDLGKSKQEIEDQLRNRTTDAHES